MLDAKKKAQLSPMNDVVFRELFGDVRSKEITKEMIEDVIGEKISIIELDKNANLFGKRASDKIGIIDVRAEINGKQQVDIELQRAKQESFAERILFYWARLYERQIQRGKNYDVLERSIIIAFVDYETEILQGLPADTKWQVIESKHGKKVLTNRLEVHIISIPKIKESVDNESIIKWVEFLENPYREEITKMTENEEGIKKAVERLNEINGDEETIREAELREKYILDYNSAMSTAKHDGIKEGVTKRKSGRC